MFRRPKIIIAIAAVSYLAALWLAWQVTTRMAERRMLTILESAEAGYSAVVDGEIEAALRNVGGAIINLLDGKCTPQPLARMRELAATFNIDEINIIDPSGRVVGSNIKSVLGFDFASDPRTAEFLTLMTDTATLVSQPFRAGVANPDMVCKYYGMAFPDHRGLIQLGVTVGRLRQNMYTYTEEEADRILREWHFSVVGWYERSDYSPSFAPGRVFRRWDPGLRERVVARQFDYHGYHYAALLPESFCYAQRNFNFTVTMAILGVLIAVFTYILVRLVAASVKLESFHAAASARSAADLALARTIQMAQLPPADGAFFDDFELSLWAESLPAREVGGDFYDFYPLPDGRLAFVIADVSGKGIPAAMFMMEAKNEIKNCLVGFSDIAEAVSVANARLCANNRAEMFVTAFVMTLDRSTGAVEYVNAGHNRPFLRSRAGEVTKVMGKGGRFLGMFEQASYRAASLTLKPGDILYLYTDGLTEAMNARSALFGEARLVECLQRDVTQVKAAIAAFVGEAEQSDDLTAMAIRYNGAPTRNEREFPASASSLAAAVDFLRTALSGLGAKSVAALINAADEITSNIVNYSGAESFSLLVERGCDRVRIVFSDAGAPYDPLTHSDPDVHAAIENRPIGGLGLVMVKKLVDRVAYAFRDGRNLLTIVKTVTTETRGVA